MFFQTYQKEIITSRGTVPNYKKRGIIVGNEMDFVDISCGEIFLVFIEDENGEVKMTQKESWEEFIKEF